MAQTDISPEEWIATTFPMTTVSGVEVIYHEQNYRTQFYSVEWLAERFGEEITTAENPRQRLVAECDRQGYTELCDLFSSDGS